MIIVSLLLPVFFNFSASANDISVNPEVKPLRFLAQATKLTLKEYLQDVRAKNPAALALSQNVESLENRLHEARLQVSPQLFAGWNEGDDKTQPSSSFAPSKIHYQAWNLGLRQQTTFGLKGELKLTTTQTTLTQNPIYVDYTDVNTTKVQLDLELPLLQNAFGQATRSELRIKEKSLSAELEQARGELTVFMLAAENIYWTVSTLQQVIGLQRDNVESAKRMSNLMQRKARQNLVDDVEAFQAQAGFEARQLELEQSSNDLAAAIRSFNKMRFVDAIDSKPEALVLEPFPQKPWAEEIAPFEKIQATQARYRAMKLAGEIAREQGQIGVSNLYPEINLVGSYGINGREPEYSDSIDEAQKGDNNNWMIGVRMSVPLNVSLLQRTREGYRLKRQSGENLVRQAEDDGRRAWREALAQAKDSILLFERAKRLEDLNTKIVSRERRRLQNGRTTTFQLITAEQNLASAQISRVRTQLRLVQAYNDVLSYEGLK